MFTDNNFIKLVKKHQKEIKKFPIIFPTTPYAWAMGLKRLGVSFAEQHILVPMDGGFLHPDKVTAYQELITKQENDLKIAMEKDTRGDKFIVYVFLRYLRITNFMQTRDVNPAINSLGLDYEQVYNTPNLRRGLELAVSRMSRNM